MQGPLAAVLAGLLGLHGLIHLMGTTVYMKLGTLEGLPYKTTLLGGRWDLREDGMRVFGALWVLPAAGFVITAIAFYCGWPGWRSLLIGVTTLSLILTLLDWASAYAGAVVNVAILCGTLLLPRLLSSLVR
jgi:hypothetical protein